MTRYSPIAAILVGLISVVGAASARADAPAYIPIQGYLSDAADKPLDGTVLIRFRLYDKSEAGTKLFDETKSVAVDRGYFAAYLGEDTPIALSVFRDHPLVFVGVLVSGDADELSPRLQLATAPYAAFAQACGDASTLGGQGASAFRPSSYVPAWSEVTGKPTPYSAGAGLSLNGANQFAVDTGAIQTKLGTACTAGQYAYGVDVDGKLMCRADVNTDTTYSAGAGIDVSGGNVISMGPDSGSCSAGQVLKYNANGTWTCQTDADNGISQAAADVRYMSATVTRQERLGPTRFAGSSGWSQQGNSISLTATTAYLYASMDIPDGAQLSKITCFAGMCPGETLTLRASTYSPGTFVSGPTLLPETNVQAGTSCSTTSQRRAVSANLSVSLAPLSLHNLIVEIKASNPQQSPFYGCVIDYISNIP